MRKNSTKKDNMINNGDGDSSSLLEIGLYTK